MTNSKRIAAVILVIFMIIGTLSAGAMECKGGRMGEGQVMQRGFMGCAKGEMKMASECAKGEKKCDSSECAKGEMKCEASECAKGEKKCDSAECAKGEKKCDSAECAKGEKKCDSAECAKGEKKCESSECEKECKEECGAAGNAEVKANKKLRVMALCPFFNNSGRTPKMFVVGSQQISMLCASKADKE